MLEGKKTYIAAIGFVGLAIFQYWTGDYVQGSNSILAALTAFGLRQAVATAAPPADAVKA